MIRVGGHRLLPALHGNLTALDRSQGEKYDESVDIWAVGIIMFELLVGRPPFEAPVRRFCGSSDLLLVNSWGVV